ncbi:pyridoxal kinase-like isoform X1 [Haliotis rufescens]|uniref:pyridoxal kinase-like isoform X1 n=1 Tax=Haliotis rufescens TaxID=6454 RepID=UPI001EAFEA3A|nr:pyridoxal kinase-like isoform X1 [Haliotis rufescens]
MQVGEMGTMKAGSLVLSLQPSFVWGSSGSSVTTFLLQVHGFDVSTINSVQFSNHTGYGKFKGQVLDDQDVTDLYEGLKLNNLVQFSHILTGYIGSKSFLEKVKEIIQELRSHNPSLIYVCDPVMGDNGKMYVPENLLEVYRESIVPLADIVTPNQFELELLTRSKVTNETEALAAMEMLHNKGVKTVVLSSSSLGRDGVLICLASSNRDGVKECYRIEIPLLPAIFVGTGDLFAASLMVWMQKDNSLKVAFEKTISTVQAVIRRTLDYARKVAGEHVKPTPAQMELRLVQSKDDLENPKILYTAELFS